MATSSVRLSGFKELEAALKELPKSTGKNVVKRVLLKAAKPIDNDASANAPTLTGKLQRSVITGTRLTRSQRSGGATQQGDGSFRAAAKNYVEVHVGTALPRGQFQEFGTVDQAAQPFMTSAWEANKHKALDIIKDDLGAEIEKAATRLARKRAKG